MQLDLLDARPRPRPPESDTPPGWTEVCPLRWVRYAGPYRLVVQRDGPADPWRWWVQRWPGVSGPKGTAPAPRVGVLRAEAALADLVVRT